MNDFENNVSVSTDEVREEMEAKAAKALMAASETASTEATYDSSTATLMGASWTNETYGYSTPNTEFPNEARNPVIGKENNQYDYAMKHGRNQEYYRDPTYHSAKKRMDISGKKKKDYTSAPVYVSRKSRRYETIGLIMRIVDLAGFELVDRIRLKDKTTGEILQ